MKRPDFFITILYLLLYGGLMAGAEEPTEMLHDMKSLFPDEISNWNMTEEYSYSPENLYDYIDGGAELYLSYGFDALMSRSYEQEGQPDIIIDIFDMGRSENAFGVFSYSREMVDSAFGQGSQYTAGLLLFWKGPYYVSILASPETPESRSAVFEAAGYIDRNIEKTGPLPRLVRLLPSENLLEKSIRYFRHYIWLNSHYFISEENIFHINDRTDAVLARYDEGLLLMIEYPATDTAGQAYDSFLQNYMPEKPNGNIMQIEDKTWIASRLSGNVIIAVFDARTCKDAEALLKRSPEFR